MEIIIMLFWYDTLAKVASADKSQHSISVSGWSIQWDTEERYFHTSNL